MFSSICGPQSIEDAALIETCICDESLSETEKTSVAYVAGWLEKKCEDELVYADDEPKLTNEAKNFIEEVSNEYLTVLHECTYQLVRIGLCFVKKTRHRACCRKRLINILSIMDMYYDFG